MGWFSNRYGLMETLTDGEFLKRLMYHENNRID